MADAISGVPDRDLIARVRAGDTKAFENLFDALYPEMVSLCAAKLRDDEAAKDLVCGVFADLFFRRTDWEPSGMSVRAYFVRAVLNRSINAMRDNRTSQKNSVAVQVEMDTGLFGAVTLPPDAQLEEREAAEMAHDKLAGALAELPDRYREVLVLRWQQELTFAEIAQVLGMTEVAVRKLLSRASQRLKEVLAAASQNNS